MRKIPHVEFKGLKGVIILLVLVVLIVLYYFHISTKIVPKEENSTKPTKVQEVLSRNLSIDYPSTPKEVVKYFSEITKCFYNETYSDEELTSMADRMRLLYDDDLLEKNEYVTYIFDLKSDIKFYKDNGYKISSYAVSASTDVEFFSLYGKECARLWCQYTIKSGQDAKTIHEVFILRKDEKSHWRIFGWDEVDE